MKFVLIFAMFMTFGDLKTLSRGFDDKAVEKAFVDISNFLAKRNHLVSIVAVGRATSQVLMPAAFASTVSIPHRVYHVQEEKISQFMLNSSAIVSFDSVATLKRFNDEARVSLTFSTSEQMFIHI